MPKIVTPATRAIEIAAFHSELSGAIKRAAAATSAETAQAAWLEVATVAGNIQRRARPLAGLGRGG